MIKIKQIGLPPSGAHWSYGPNHMRQISKKSAAALCGMYPLPKMGYETIVAIKPDVRYPSFKLRLAVHNVSGIFYLASTDAKVENWPAEFGIEVTE